MIIYLLLLLYQRHLVGTIMNVKVCKFLRLDVGFPVTTRRFG